MFRVFLFLIFCTFSYNVVASTCTDMNTQSVTNALANCAAYNCSNHAYYCTGISVGPSHVQEGIWLKQHVATCGVYPPLDPDFFYDGELRNCSAIDGTSIVTKAASSVLNSQKQCGSIVSIEERVLAERIEVLGVNFALLYSTKFVNGTAKNFKAKSILSRSTLETDIIQFDISIERSGLTTLTDSLPNNLVDRVLDIEWDGKDSLGNEVQGYKKFKTTVSEKFATYSFPVISEFSLGGFRSKFLGLGGWAPSIFRYYDPVVKKLVSVSGEVTDVTAKAFATGQVYVASLDGSEVYIFDSSNGRHLFTKTGLTGTTKFTFNYDGSGRLSSVVEPFGRTTTFDRDLSGDLVSITSPKGQITTVSLDSNDYLASVQSPSTATFNMTYTSGGLLSTFSKPGGQNNTFSYDSEGSLLSDSHSGGFAFTLTKNAPVAPDYYNNDISLTSAMGRTSRVQSSSTETSNNKTSFDWAGVSDYRSYRYISGGIEEARSFAGTYSSQSSSPNSRFPGMAYYPASSLFTTSGLTRQISTALSSTLSDPSDPFSVATYSMVSSLVGMYTQVTTTYNPSTKVFSSSTYLGKTQSIGIDSLERPVSVQTGTLNSVGLNYTNENLTSIVQGARTTALTYNVTSGLLESITDPLSLTTSFVRNSAGRVVSKVLPDSRTIGFGYDVNGNITSVTPPMRPTHYFSLNGSEDLNSYAPPALSGVSLVSTSYSYNLDRQLTQISRPDGKIVNLNYDTSTSRLVSYTTSDGTYTYNMSIYTGLPDSIVKPDGARTEIEYLGATPIGTKIYNSAATAYNLYKKAFNSVGNVWYDYISSELYGISTIYYQYNDDEDLLSAGDLTLSYGVPNGQLTGTSLGSGATGITDSYTYNAYGEVTGYQASYGPTQIYNLSLTRDSVGRISGKTQAMNSITNAFDYTFDVSGRLSQVSKNSAVAANYGYDDNSNRNSGNIGAQTTTATYDDQDRLNAYNTLVFTYNANGDLLTKTNTTTSTTTTYTYDVFGNLTTVVLPGGTTITYEIDALNRRVAKSLNGVLQKRWAYMDQYRIAAELSPSGDIDKRFVYGSKGNVPDYMILAGETYRIISDHLGSPRLVVKQSDGTIVQRMDHDEYGRVTEDTNPGYLPFGFAGGLYDNQTGLVRFGVRDYESEVGRWTSKDPILFRGQMSNLYGYSFNDPVNFMDFSGLWGFQIGGGFGFMGGTIGFAGESGIAVSYSAECGLQFGSYQSIQTRAGMGIQAGMGINLTFTPDAMGISDLGGWQPSVGFDTPLRIGSGAGGVSDINNQPAGSISIGFGPSIGAAGYLGVGYTKTSDALQITSKTGNCSCR